MSLASSYVGRTVDLLAFRGVYPPPVGVDLQLSQQLARGDGGLLCTGLDKACQRVVYLLTNKQGTLLYSPQTGTTFMSQAELGYWRTVADVQLAFASARLDVMRQLAAMALPDDPPEEQVVGLSLESVGLSGDGVRLGVAVSTLAGDSRKFVVPISVPVR